jgi:WD40 repeat protein
VFPYTTPIISKINKETNMNFFSLKQILLSITFIFVILYTYISLKDIYALTQYQSAYVAMIPNSNFVVSGSKSGVVQIWNMETGKMEKEWEGNGLKDIDSLVVTADAKYLFLGLHSGDIIMLDLKDGKTLKEFKGHTWTVTSLVLSSDNKKLVSGSFDADVKVWDIETEKELLSTRASNHVCSLVLTSDEKGIVAGQVGGAITLLDFETLEVLNSTSTPNGAVISLVTSKDGRELIAGLEDGKVKRFKLPSLEKISTFDKHRKYSSVFAVALTKDEQFVVSAAGDKSIRIWDRLTGKEIRVLEGHTASILSLALSSDENSIVSSSSDGTVRIWDFKMGKEIKKLKYK